MLQGARCGRAGDAWALGVLLFEMLTLRPPFAIPPGAHEVALLMVISSYDGKLEPSAAAALRGCAHPRRLCALADAGGLLHPSKHERLSVDDVLAVTGGVRGAPFVDDAVSDEPPPSGPLRLRPPARSVATGGGGAAAPRP